MPRLPKWKISDCQTFATVKGGVCLDTEYKNNKHQMQWKCSEGHTFTANFGQVKDIGQWCRECSIIRRRTGIEECQKAASERGGKCLTTEYKRNTEHMLWECKEGHQWNATFGHIKNSKSWCPKCVGHDPITIQDCQKRASDLGGECLSDTYTWKGETRWRCKEGHEWESKFMRCTVQWCPYCAGNFNNNLEVCQNYAKSKGGKCLSTEYKNSGEKMSWECNEGHKWKTGFGGMKNQGHWCQTCHFIHSRKFTIEMCQKMSEKHQGSCLSTKYETNKRLKWRCKEGHVFERYIQFVVTGRWCNTCYIDRVKHTIEDCQKVAEKNGGKCLSTEYVQSLDYGLIWECKEGHQWNASFSNVHNNGTWCPNCSSPYRSEALAREILEEETGYQWVKIRPKWLKGLELDGYCKELNTAFEYQGEQHYRYVPHFHRNGEEDFHNQQKRDKAKVRRAKRKGVKIIFIPYQFNYKIPDEMRTLIKDQLPSSDSDSDSS